MVIKKHVTIGAPAELIWDVIMDLRKAKEWAPGFEDYPFISSNWPSAGATAIWRYHAGPMHFDFNLQLAKAERGRLLQIANSSAFGNGMEVYRFGRSGDQTTIEYEASSRPNLLGRLFAAMMTRKLEKQMDQTVANLKRYCEARVS
jgi:carbon monoxide dehydrogenase subunit G